MVRAELPRTVRKGGDAVLLQARMMLADLAQIPLSPTMLDAAGALPGSLRTLDAIHLASALLIKEELDTFVAYDKRLLTEADAVGLPTASPSAL